MRLLALLLLLPLPAFASDYVPLREKLTPDELRAIALSQAQIEQLDAALRAAEARERKRENAPAMAPAPRVESQPAPAVTAAPTVTAAPVAPAQPRAEGPKVGLGDAPIVARAVGRIESWAPGTVFTLDNGQRWQVLKGSVTLRTPLESPRVRVVPGFSGRWFLEVTEDMPKARVFLVD